MTNKTQMTDEQIRQRVKELKTFYTNVSWHVVFNFIAMTIWLFLSSSEYWPIFVHFSSLMILGVDAYRLGLVEIPETDFIPFLREEWEEQKFAELKALHALKEEKREDKKAKAKTK